MTEEIIAPEVQPKPEQAAPSAETKTTETPAAETEQHMIPKGRFDEVNTKYKALLAEQEQAKTAAEKANRKQLEEQNKFKELYEQEQQKAAQAQAQADKVAHERLQLEVATAAGHPALWNRISGSTKDELEADMATLIKDMPKQAAPNLDGGAGSGGRKPGKPAPTEAEIREYAAIYGVNPEKYAEQYGVQLPK